MMAASPRHDAIRARSLKERRTKARALLGYAADSLTVEDLVLACAVDAPGAHNELDDLLESLGERRTFFEADIERAAAVLRELRDDPKASKWHATPPAARHRKPVNVTLSDEARGALDELSDARDCSRSEVIEAEILRAAGQR